MTTKLTRHTAYNINYHFVWCPKYRRAILTGPVADRLVELLKELVPTLDGEVF